MTEQIVAAYLECAPIAAIAKTHSISQSTVHRVISKADVDREGASRKALRKACSNCGTKCRARGDLCRTCMGWSSSNANEDALTDGRWVQRGAIKVWVPGSDADNPQPASRQRYRALVTERQDARWWPTPARPEPAPDVLSGRRRLVECVREAGRVERQEAS
ncbi:MAG TPA: hypothetical protein VGE38_04870 [Nocardioides sp.]|uniref:hypothetical protein n=1 Tax=Nocardioides sp. TaxID=35761 RepID=UPI002EDA4B64